MQVIPHIKEILIAIGMIRRSKLLRGFTYGLAFSVAALVLVASLPSDLFPELAKFLPYERIKQLKGMNERYASEINYLNGKIQQLQLDTDRISKEKSGQVETLNLRIESCQSNHKELLAMMSVQRQIFAIVMKE